MRVRLLEINRFRGINELRWAPSQPFVCLVGAGDATKSTILDAVELVLSPRWNIQFNDSDFFNADTSQPLTIRASIGDLPEELLSDAKFGYQTRGWSNTGVLHDEPQENDELLLTLQLRVDANLEPVWAVVNDRLPEGTPIRASDRDRLGCARVGTYIDRHLSWSRGAILARLTDSADGIGGVLAAAGRAARQAIDPKTLPKLGEAAKAAQTLGSALGVRTKAEFQPHLDVRAMSLTMGALALHDGSIPARASGLGSGRLLAMALQLEAAKEGGVTLIDEVEHALEPHRLRRLLRTLQEGAGPTLISTHSRLVLEELPAERLAVVRSSKDGETRVLPVPSELQPVVRSCSEALLARSVIVCEGPTEIGFLRAFDDWWGKDGDSFGLLGIALANGGGKETRARAKGVVSLGYRTAIFADSDDGLAVDVTELTEAGISMFLWGDEMAIEERVVSDLPWNGVLDLVRFAMEGADGDAELRSVCDAVGGRIKGLSSQLPIDATLWAELAGEEALREAIWVAANKKKWFKRVDLAEALGRIVIGHWTELAGTNLRTTLENLHSWTLSHG